MVSSYAIEGNVPLEWPRSSPRSLSPNKWGPRTVVGCVVLLALSAFAKTTATLALDLPGATETTHAAQPTTALRSDVTTLKIAAPSAVPVRPVAKVKLNPLVRMRTGMASWYGKVLQDHLTASGRRFDMNELTAAHRDLPFGSRVKVTDLRNHKSVIVTITDRGILTADRVIDLSYAAADALGMIKTGVDPVRLDVLKAEVVPPVINPVVE